MRKLVTLAVVMACMVFLAVAPPASAASVTLTAWTGSPVTLGDKLFTLISTNWAGDDSWNYSIPSAMFYNTAMYPNSDLMVTNTIKSLVYKVTIIDDPATSQNETVLNYFTQVSGGFNQTYSSGTIIYTVVIDNNSDFSSPFGTVTNNGQNWSSTPIMIPGRVKELYAKFTLNASAGSIMVNSFSAAYTQAEEQVSTEPATWGTVKALYR